VRTQSYEAEFQLHHSHKNLAKASHPHLIDQLLIIATQHNLANRADGIVDSGTQQYLHIDIDPHTISRVVAVELLRHLRVKTVPNRLHPQGHPSVEPLSMHFRTHQAASRILSGRVSQDNVAHRGHLLHSHSHTHTRKRSSEQRIMPAMCRPQLKATAAIKTESGTSVNKCSDSVGCVPPNVRGGIFESG